MILSFLLSNFLSYSYSGNLNRGEERNGMLKFGTPTIALPLAIKNVLFRQDALYLFVVLWLWFTRYVGGRPKMGLEKS